MNIMPYVAAGTMAGLVALAGCGDADDDLAGPDAADPSSILTPPPAGEGVQVGFDVTIAPAEETEYCQYVALPDGADLKVGRFEHAYSMGSHHLLVYATGLAPEDARDDIFPCAGASFVELGIAGIAYAAQVPEGELGYPAATAMTVEGAKVLLVQSHYLNATSEPIDAKVRVNLWAAEEPVEVEAGTLFFYDYAIVVPPNQASTARMACQVPADVELQFAMSHMHRRGVGFRSWLDGGGLAEPVGLVESTEWEGVEPQRFDPSQPVSGGQTIHFECDYQGEDRTIIEGPSAEDNEMCMFIASYYPRLDAGVETCTGPGSGPVLDGDVSCAATLQCVQAADDPVVAEQCVLDTCAGAADETRTLMSCMFQFCRTPCADPGDPACTSCMTDSCEGPVGACLSSTCEDA